jgi:hypothetical protein
LGFISAGGIGKTELSHGVGRSELYGGFWRNVYEFAYLDGNANLHTISSSSELFYWFFGSLGQFGIVVEAKIRLITKQTFSPNYILNPPNPLGASGSLSCSSYQADSRRTLWVSVFSNSTQLDTAWKILFNWVLDFSNLIKPVPEARWAGPVYQGLPVGYQYQITSDGYNPPLLYFHSGSFTVLGVAFVFKTGDHILNIELANSLNFLYGSLLGSGFLLYPSVENITASFSFNEYYPPHIVKKARSIRESSFCTNFLNRGWLEDDLLNPSINYI